MTLIFTTLCFILVWTTIAFYLVEGYGSSRNADLVLETIHGDIYDCVDVYKQPTLLHPMPHKERIKMTIAKELEKQRSVKAKRLLKDENIYFKAEEFWLNKKGCPIGTVPIRRLTQEQLQNAKDASLSMANKSLAEDIIDFAGISINASPEIKSFTSATATVTLYNLHVNGLGQYSSATVFHQSADNATNFEQIQAGWIVHPQLYGDSRTRLYSHWTTDGGQKTGCYNNICPGFVQLDTEVPIDYAFPKISRPMYDDEELLIQIYKDQDYYLYIQSMFSIGFWPETMFNELRNGSQVVRYGGQAFTPAGQQYSPPMGNGNFQDGNPHTTCHMRQVLYGVGYNTEVQPDESLVQTHQSRCYHEGSQHNAHDDYWDYNFLFGGGGFC
ncbi:hypothetical protein KY290_023462 [Solanum tuberosum]|uniref:Neprosin PEP catalytic domain-containing protein n=1 Tax=Solanum tuberosum TaxID=4113 RepID=A0ABQ7V8Z4_SOLTU|nr:hypothetical protein KY289_021055 [Solanum tuberosum]KAH0693718.1 hypothetical protein KY285_020815 [Solanum tuberosum]KAH0759969.1 hypothetical protein KY290_023462 [Solanum tuberosum]